MALITWFLPVIVLLSTGYKTTNHFFKSDITSQSKLCHVAKSKKSYCNSIENSNGDQSAVPEYNVFMDLRNKLKGTSIYLVGMMGSGKTSIGNELTQQMSYRFLDTDQIAEFMIERKRR